MSNEAAGGYIPPELLAEMEPNSEKPIDSAEGLYGLLLTSEQESSAREKIPDWPKYEYRLQNDDSELTIFGYKHASTPEEVQPIVDAFVKANPDLLLVEGMADEISQAILDGKVSDIAALPTEQRDAAILSRYQEQVYMAWKARQFGKEVRSWDLKPSEQLLAGLEQANPEEKRNQLEYYLNIGVLKLLETGQPPHADRIVQLIIDNFGLPREELARVGLTAEALQMVASKPIEQINIEEARAKTTPAGEGPANVVLRDINTARDRHAIDVFAEAKNSHKKVFVTSGSSHALTWEPALRALY